MTTSFPHLPWVRTFEACARHRSFARAAEELGLTPAAVGQHIRHLEAQLGFALFKRMARGIALTPIGRDYAPIVTGLLDDFAAGTVALFGIHGGRTITLRCVASFASLRLPRILHRFAQAYPGVSVQVQTPVWSDDADATHVDLEVRYGSGLWPDYDAIALSEGISYPLCPPGNAMVGDTSTALYALARQAPIHILGMENLWRKLAVQLGWPEQEMQAGITVDTSAIALELVAAGAGSAIIDAQLCHLHLERGLVVHPGGIALRHEQRHYICIPRTSHITRPEVLVLRDWIRAQTDQP